MIGIAQTILRARAGKSMGATSGIFWNTAEADPAVVVTGNLDDYYKQIRVVGMADDGSINKVLATYFSPKLHDADTDGSQGQVMVEFPRIWYKESFDGDGYLTRVDVSTYAKAGYDLHPCFSWGNGREYTYIGAYEGSFVDNKLASVSGQSLRTSRTLAQYYTEATARTSPTGIWFPHDFWGEHLINLLYYIYSKQRNSQAYLPGYTNRSAYLAAEIRPSGRSNILTTVNGSVEALTGAGEIDADLATGWQAGLDRKVANRFLFIENFYGNIWKFLHGCSFDGRIGVQKTAWVTNDPRIFSSVEATIISTYNNLNINLLSVDTTSYIRNVGKGFLPVQDGGASDTYYSDLFYSYLTDAANRNYLRSVLAGGFLFLGVGAGVAARAALNALGAASASVGSRLRYANI